HKPSGASFFSSVRVLIPFFSLLDQAMLFPEKCDYKETKKNENSLRLFLMTGERPPFHISLG
ncbi:MAG TPA: hypothetical protein VK541_17965, partial [Pedobacter sp.]|uniref:hypothetical protein n=1 Tax=Pedobacter sp. TaxID=1411316 RepID=UPI002C86280E